MTRNKEDMEKKGEKKRGKCVKDDEEKGKKREEEKKKQKEREKKLKEV